MEYKNFAYSAVATAPSPASSGTSLVVTTGDGSKFPVAPFYATVWPAGVRPLTTNAEIVLVTVKSTDTLTITRQQEGSSARSIVVGDQIAATITAATIPKFRYLNIQIKTDTYTLDAADDIVVCNKSSAMSINLPAASGSGKLFHIKNINTGTVTVDGNSSDTIDDETTQLLGQWDTLSIVDYASNKWVII
jgi:hypothetical protein